MIEVLQSILALIASLSILVTFHELGHYWVARWCNVHVLRFSLGFGKPIYTKRGKPIASSPPADASIQTRSNEPLIGTDFIIASIPLGGYVQMLDEREGFVADDLKHLAFNRKPVLQRMAIVAAGPLANFLLAIMAYWFVFTFGVTGIVPKLGHIDAKSPAGIAGLHQGQEIIAIDAEPTSTWADVNRQLFSRIGDTGDLIITAKPPGSHAAQWDYQIPIHSWLSHLETPYPTTELGLLLDYPPVPALIGKVIDGEAAERAGIQSGDKVVAFNNQTVSDWLHLVNLIASHPNQTISLTINRNNQLIKLSATLKSVAQEGHLRGRLGVFRQPIALPEDMQRTVHYPVSTALLTAMRKTWSMTLFTLVAIKKMLIGAISTKNLSGPITIAQVAKATAQSGIGNFVSFIALLSISLGVINLLPIPMLDGGHLLYQLMEFMTGKPVSARIQAWSMQMGMFVIAGLMLLAFYNDLTRL